MGKIDLTKNNNPILEVKILKGRTKRVVVSQQSFSVTQDLVIELGDNKKIFIKADSFIGKACSLGEGACIGRGCKLAQHSRVGFDSILRDGVKFDRGVKVGNFCEIGEDTHIFKGAKVSDKSKLGARVEVRQGAEIGVNCNIGSDVTVPFEETLLKGTVIRATVKIGNRDFYNIKIPVVS